MEFDFLKRKVGGSIWPNPNSYIFFIPKTLFADILRLIAQLRPPPDASTA